MTIEEIKEEFDFYVKLHPELKEHMRRLLSILEQAESFNEQHTLNKEKQYFEDFLRHG
jgi:hypothetical protein